MRDALHTPFTAVRALATKLDERPGDYDAVVALAAGRRYVLLGEATHGTREFYAMRAAITRRLIADHGFEAVAIEGDWPDVARLERYVTGHGDDVSAEAALGDFERFPAWLWRNHEIRDFVHWLRGHNAGRTEAAQAGLYGLDLYSLYRSADGVIRYLQSVDPEQAEIARQRYAALDHVRDPQTYGYQVAMRLRPAAQQAVQQQLEDLRARAPAIAAGEGPQAVARHFEAERNAAAVLNAEAYYRAMFGSRVNTWNLRDAHMRDTLFALSAHLRRRGGSGRVVVWAHNSHLGDARATQPGRHGEWNLGQLVREQAGAAALLVGFTTYTGRVAAASRWDGEVEHKRVRPALAGSYEQLFQSTRLDRFFLPLSGEAAAPLREPLLERAIGVLYLPHTERASHYFDASLPGQFDAVFHLDETSAVEPLDLPRHWRAEAEADTYPFGV